MKDRMTESCGKSLPPLGAAGRRRKAPSVACRTTIIGDWRANDGGETAPKSPSGDQPGRFR